MSVIVSKKTCLRFTCGAVALLAVSPQASAVVLPPTDSPPVTGPVFAYENNAPAEGEGIQTYNTSVTFDRVSGSYDSGNEILDWQVELGPGDGSDRVPNKFALVVNNGDHPFGHQGELVTILADFDAEIISTYLYNGDNLAASYLSSTFAEDDLTPAEQIASSITDTGLVRAASSTTDADGVRTLSFSLNASILNDFTPSLPATNELANGSTLEGGFQGVGFDENIGIWLHIYDGDFSYDANGFVTALPASVDPFSQGDFVDLANQATTTVPEPTALALLALGGVSLIGRRRQR